MKIGILQVGQVAPEVLAGIQQGLAKAFPDTTATVIEKSMPVPQGAFDKKRKQYNSTLILNEVKDYAAKNQDFHRVLGSCGRGHLYIWLKLCIWRSLHAWKRRVNFALAAKTSILQRQTRHGTLHSAGAKGGNSRARSHIGRETLPAVLVCNAFF